MLIFAANLPKAPWKEKVSPKRFPKFKDPNVRRFSKCIEERLEEVLGSFGNRLQSVKICRRIGRRKNSACSTKSNKGAAEIS
jgi:hypothetical protein